MLFFVYKIVGIMNKVKGLLQLLRFELPLAAGVCVVLGQLFALGKFPQFFLILNSFFSVFFISGSILVLNDYFDVETDRINSPHRPIPSNRVTRNEALIFALLLITSGIFLSYMINQLTFILALILALVGFLYNRYFKKSGLAGNLMVSFSVGMTFIYGGASVGLQYNEVVVFFAIIAALIDLGEEIAADAMDMEGDKLINSRSIAIKYGKQKALRISAVIFFIVVLLSVIPFLKQWFSLPYLFPIIIMDISIIYSTVKILHSGESQARKYIRFLYLGSTAGLIIFLLMRLIYF